MIRGQGLGARGQYYDSIVRSCLSRRRFFIHIHRQANRRAPLFVTKEPRSFQRNPDLALVKELDVGSAI